MGASKSPYAVVIACQVASRAAGVAGTVAKTLDKCDISPGLGVVDRG